MRSQVLQWGHSSRIVCHPGYNRTLNLLQRGLHGGLPWMLTLKPLLQPARVCVRGKASHQPSAGLLRPLPIASRPWSHIAMDFITGLPPSQGNTTILTIVIRFSKSVHFVALQKLPSARETAEILIDQVFRCHRIPSDIVSDCGPQFISSVWKAFCTALGASVSLSSGYHPQTIGKAEWANQDLEAALWCVATQNPASWSSHLTWVEYAHNSLHCTAAGMTPLSVPWGTYPCCSLYRRLKSLFPRYNTISAAAAEFGRVPALPCSVQLNRTVAWLPDIAPQLPPTIQVRKFGKFSQKCFFEN